ncbi:MAG TPA: FAD-dependent oxidoreductase, partial [Anaerolineae bacterium]
MSQAVIIGGGIAGMATARVLSDHFDRVISVDRDHFPTSPSFRSGTPQAHHIHVLLMEGQRLLEEMFPGLQAELATAGAQEMDWTADCLWYGFGKWGPRFRSGLVTHFASRALLEYTIRGRLVRLPNVQVMTGNQVTGLMADANATRITGVRFRSREADQPEELRELRADLVVDASGRESKMPQWLQELG